VIERERERERERDKERKEGRKEDSFAGAVCQSGLDMSRHCTRT